MPARNDAPERRRGSPTGYHVYFPCVHGEMTGELVEMFGFREATLRSTLKSTSEQIEQDEARRLIGITRYEELDARKAEGVILSVTNTRFSGDSYELALVLLDKIARYRKTELEMKVVATGRIQGSGHGKVAAIEQFQTKLRVVLENSGNDSVLFVYPEENRRKASPTEEALLTQLEDNGVELCAIEHINEVDKKLWHTPENQFRIANQWKFYVPALLVLITLAGFGIANWRQSGWFPVGQTMQSGRLAIDSATPVTPTNLMEAQGADMAADQRKQQHETFDGKVDSDTKPQITTPVTAEDGNGERNAMESDVVDTDAY